MSDHDPVMERIQAGIRLVHGGERVSAREHFSSIWSDVGADGEPLHRCVLSHFMADVQDDPVDELLWDRRALEAAATLTDERLAALDPGLTVRAFLPSLHLNLAASLLRVGSAGEARVHVAHARAAADALDDGGFVRFLRGGIERIERELDRRG